MKKTFLPLYPCSAKLPSGSSIKGINSMSTSLREAEMGHSSLFLQLAVSMGSLQLYTYWFSSADFKIEDNSFFWHGRLIFRVPVFQDLFGTLLG